MTEAIDTVMSPEERIKFDKRFTTGSVNLKGLAEAQAEISFPKGEKQGYDKGYTEARNHCEDILLPQERLEGRKEVVEWINERIDWKFALDAQLGGHISLNTQQWQAKLKEWGL